MFNSYTIDQIKYPMVILFDFFSKQTHNLLSTWISFNTRKSRSLSTEGTDECSYLRARSDRLLPASDGHAGRSTNVVSGGQPACSSACRQAAPLVRRRTRQNDPDVVAEQLESVVLVKRDELLHRVEDLE